MSQRFSAILDSSSEAILSKTTDGVITTWNEAAARMYGYSAEEVIGRHISILVPEERRAELITIMHRVTSGSTVERLETVRLRKDATEARVILNVSPLFDAEGVVVGAITVASDVTEQRRRGGRPRAGRGPVRRGVPTVGVRDGHGRPGGPDDRRQPRPRRVARPVGPRADRPSPVRLRGAGVARGRRGPVAARRDRLLLRRAPLPAPRRVGGMAPGQHHPHPRDRPRNPSTSWSRPSTSPRASGSNSSSSTGRSMTT